MNIILIRLDQRDELKASKIVYQRQTITEDIFGRMEKISYVLSCVVPCMWWQLISVADDQNNCYHHTCILHKQTIPVAEYI